MSTPQVYGRLGSALITADSLENRRSALGLYMTAGVASSFRRGDITEAEARRQINTITGSGQIPNPHVLQQLSAALEGSRILEQSRDSSGTMLDAQFKLLGLTSPLFSMVGGVVVGLIS